MKGLIMMMDFIAEFVGGMIELVIDLLIEPQMNRLIEKRKQVICREKQK